MRARPVAEPIFEIARASFQFHLLISQYNMVSLNSLEMAWTAVKGER